jgi:hypothetical protein
MQSPQTFADRYVALWNETDAEARRRGIAALFAPDGQHYVGVRHVSGYAALEERIAGSHVKNVQDGGNRFRVARGAKALHDTVTFFWEMVPDGDETVLATGLEFLILDSAGRILTDYQFILDQPPAA